MSKKEIRKNILSFRRGLSQDEILNKSRKVSKNLQNFLASDDDYQIADNVLCFYPLKREINLLLNYEKILNSGKTLYFPVTNLDMSMEFYSVPDLSENNFVKGLKDISEPVKEYKKYSFSEREGKKLFILMPGLAFSLDGGRIGYGGGCYDRYIKRLIEKNVKFITIGVAFSEQVFKDSFEFELEDFDRRLDFLITDSDDLRWFKCQK